MVRSTEMRTSMRLNGARAICQSLIEEGVSTIFGLPGGAIMPLYDVLPEFPQLKHILVRHEQCAARSPPPASHGPPRPRPRRRAEGRPADRARVDRLPDQR